jgi:phage terminase, small subunit
LLPLRGQENLYVRRGEQRAWAIARKIAFSSGVYTPQFQREEVAAMANGHGGARIGAGQKKKALSDKLVEGNPGKRKLTVMEFTDTADLQGETMPPPRDYLAARQKNGKELLAVEVYERTWTWLHERGCAHLIPAQILEQYAMAISRWIQCEECITEYGFLAKHPTTGNAIPSPYVSMSQSFSKQANNLWFQIYQVVRENCSTEYKGATPHDDMMERLLSARRGG